MAWKLIISDTAEKQLSKLDRSVSTAAWLAGAFMGYAIGALLAQQQRGETAMRLSLTPQSVVANWAVY